MIHHGPVYLGFRHVVRSVAVWVAFNSLLANFLPNEKRFLQWPRVCRCYVWLVDFVAFNALNFRACLPSLQQEFMGFRRSVRRKVHGWTAEVGVSDDRSA